MIARYRPSAVTWEAVSSAGFTLDQVRRRGATLAAGLAAKGLSCLIASDTRFMGGLFARDLATALQSRGVRIALSGAPTPLPALYHALEQRTADCALYVSARNRPYVYNGLVLLAPAAAALSLDPADPVADAPFPPSGEPEQTVDLKTPYLEALRAAVDLELIRRTTLTIFVDAMGGTAGGIFSALFGESGQTRAIEINREPDPTFGRAAPAPVGAGLTRLKKLVRESDSHLGLAISGDGTALAVVDKNAEQLDPAETALLLGAYMARQHRQRGAIVVPAPAPGSPLATVTRHSSWEEATGLKLESGGERTAPVLSATAEGELTIGKYAAYSDGILAGLLCAEMLARSGGNLRALIDAQREQLLRG